MKGDRGQTSLSCTVLRVNLAWFPCKIILRLPPSSLGLAQDTSLLSQVQAQERRKCAESRGPLSKSSSLSSGVVPSTAAVAAANRSIVSLVAAEQQSEQLALAQVTETPERKTSQSSVGLKPNTTLVIVYSFAQNSASRQLIDCNRTRRNKHV